jgi:aldose 1-epimerase
VTRYVMTNSAGMRVAILTYGGIIQSLQVPDRRGRSANVVLGYDNLDAYLDRGAFFGAIIGRYADRIAGGRFTLDGTTYTLARTGTHQLHGGPQGFHKRIWAATPFEQTDRVGVVLRYRSLAGEMGFPARWMPKSPIRWMSGTGCGWTTAPSPTRRRW